MKIVTTRSVLSAGKLLPKGTTCECSDAEADRMIRRGLATLIEPSKTDSKDSGSPSPTDAGGGAGEKSKRAKKE